MSISLGQKILPRKKRRKLQAAREMLEDEDQIEKSEVRFSASILMVFASM